jgi:hypothetical protein
MASSGEYGRVPGPWLHLVSMVVEYLTGSCPLVGWPPSYWFRKYKFTFVTKWTYTGIKLFFLKTTVFCE